MHHVLISYSRRDKVTADDLAFRLSSSGVPIWIDERDIPCSVPWFDEIESAIREASLLVIVESVHWYTSQHCAVELSEAELWGVPVVRVSSVWTELDESVATIREAFDRIPQQAPIRTELLVRAHDWEAAGRPRSALASGAPLRAFRRIVRLDIGPEPDVVLAYVRRSSRRQRNRRGWAAALVLVLVASVLGTVLIGAMRRRISDNYGTDLVAMTGLALFRSVNETSPFRGTEFALQHVPRAAASAVDRAQADTPAKIAALEASQPPLADGFVARTELGETLERIVPTLVSGPDGKHHDPAAVGSRLEARSGAGDLVVQARVGDTQLSITNVHSRSLYRRVGLPAAATAIAFAPDGRTLVVAVGLEVLRFDVATGAVCQRLQGAVKPLTRLSWSTDGRTLQAADTEGRVIAWSASPGEQVLSDPSRWFVGAAAVRGKHLVAALSRDGMLDVVDTTTARVQSSQMVGTAPSSRLTASLDGTIAVLSPLSQTPIALVTASGGGIRRIATPGCHPNDVSFATSGNLLIACDEGIGVLNTASGKLGIHPLGSGDGARSIAAAGAAIVVSTSTGNIETIDADGVAGFSGRARNCPGSARWLAATRTGSMVFTAGSGGGIEYCAARYRPGGTFPVGDAAPVDGHTTSTESVAVSPDDSLVAYGYADGSVTVADIETYDPVGFISGASGSVRGVAFNDDSRRLLFVTREGLIVLADLPLARLNGAQLMAAAQSRLTLAQRSGLYSKNN